MTAQAYIKVPLTPTQTTAAMPLLQGLQTLYSLANVPAGYTTTPVFANNMADPNGVDVFGGTIDQCIWFALLAAKPANLARYRATLGGARTASESSVSVLRRLWSATDPLAGVGTASGGSGDLANQRQRRGGAPLVYHSLSVASDTTQGLTTAGVVQLMLPQSVGYRRAGQRCAQRHDGGRGAEAAAHRRSRISTACWWPGSASTCRVR